MRASARAFPGTTVFSVLGMRRATVILPAVGSRDKKPVATVTLDFDERYRRRIKLFDDDGNDFLLDLAQASHLRDGDGLQLEDGKILLVKAADERVIDIRSVSAGEQSRIAWHLGNRHTPVQILSNGALRIRYDHVLKELVERLGADVCELAAPFDPESGAYFDNGQKTQGVENHAYGHGEKYER